MAISHQENDEWLAGYDAEEAPIVRAANNPRDVYELYRAIKVGHAPLLVVDSVRNAELARNLFPGCVVVTWTGERSEQANWAALKARENLSAILLPSNDPVAQHEMDMVSGELDRLGFSLEEIKVSHMPDGWTLSDEQEWTAADAKRLYEDYRFDLFMDRPIPLPEPVRGLQRVQTDDDGEIRDPFGESMVIPTNMPVHLKEEALDMLDKARRDDTTTRMGNQGWTDAGLDMVAGKPVPNVSNVSLILGRFYKDMVWYDSFLSRIRTHAADRQETRDWTDPDDIRITIELQRAYGMAKVSRDIVHQAIVEHAYRNVKNELLEFLGQIEPWDGVSRIEHFFVDCAGTPDSDYARAAGRNFWIGLAARALKPGCKLDTMVILEGKQGKSKSTLLEVIGGRWYAIMSAAPDSNDFAITLAGKWVIEVAELQSFSKADENSVKRTLRTASDRYRPPYGRHAEDHPRSSILAGSTNQDDYNMDSTGFRHGWPIKCGDIRLDLARDNRRQLIAEAMHCFNRGDTWWEMPTKETERQQKQRYVGDPWEARVRIIIANHSQVTIPGIMEDLKLSMNEQNRSSQMRISNILKAGGWVKVTAYDSDVRSSVRRWMRDEGE